MLTVTCLSAGVNASNVTVLSNGFTTDLISNCSCDAFRAITRVIALNASQLQFEIKSVVNPFDNTVTFDAFTPADKQVTVSILDCYGRQLASGTRYLYQGYNKVDITGLGALSKGIYILRIVADGQVINKQVLKAGK